MDKTLLSGRVEGRVVLPCSKSYAQRALAASLLCRGRSTLRNMDLCCDTQSALRCIEALGAKVNRLSETEVEVCGGLAPAQSVLYVGESGLATRLFTPIASLCDSPITICGEGTLLHRPMEMMVEPLRRLGVDVRDGGGRLPIEVCGPMRGGEIEVDGSISSQFVTGLLLALPLAAEDTVLHVHGAVSRPYLDMTIATAEWFGVRIQHSDYEEFFVEGGQSYQPADVTIEGDWSAAASMLVAGAVAGAVEATNLSLLSRQADVAICEALVRAGASVVSDQHSIRVEHRPLHAFEFDATNSPDLFPALAALAAAAEGESVIKGVSRLEHKESNRAEAIRSQYGRLGIEVDLSGDDVMKIRGARIVGGVECDSLGDHRMAMSLAIAALVSEQGVTVRNAESVAKSYPRFFDDLDSLMVK